MINATAEVKSKTGSDPDYYKGSYTSLRYGRFEMGRHTRWYEISNQAKNKQCMLSQLRITILQWNARSLLANGQDFKQLENRSRQRREKLDILCIQETCLKLSLDLVLFDYIMIRMDGEHGGRGGCATFIQERSPF